MTGLLALLRGGGAGGSRVVPPSGFAAGLTVFAAAAMAFLAVFAIAFALATTRLAERWEAGLAGSVTVRLPADVSESRLDAVLSALGTTPGVAAVHALSTAESAALLEPWLGPGLILDALPVPRLVEVELETGGGFDADGLRARLAAEAPGAVLDDHGGWRRPLVAAASRLRLLGWGAVALIAAALGAIVALAARAALAANREVLGVLRLVGARDARIVHAFVRRFTIRAGLGAGAGTVLGAFFLWSLPSTQAAGGFLTGLAFTGAGWLALLVVPLFAAAVAFWTTRACALRTLREIP